MKRTAKPGLGQGLERYNTVESSIESIWFRFEDT